jgi:hypothetical protein
MASKPITLLFALALGILAGCVEGRGYSRRDDTPQLPFDPDTTEYCTWWIDNDGSSSCREILSDWIISLDDFRRWVSPPFKISYELTRLIR